MNGIKRVSKGLVLTTNKEGTTKWSSTQKVTFNLYNEVASNNKLSFSLDHGTNKKANTQ